MIGQSILHYRVIEKLRGGGLGIVYQAQDTRFHRFVALKFLPEGVARDPHIGEQHGKAFTAMEFLEGAALKHRSWLCKPNEGRLDMKGIGVLVDWGKPNWVERIASDMRNRLSLFGILLAVVVALPNCGCGGGSASTLTTTSISVSMPQATATVQAGATAQFTATVANDTASKGVAWTVSCSAIACGSVSPTATASGVPTTYSAPSPTSNLTVTLTATSVADGTKFASAIITVSVSATTGITVSVSPPTATVQLGATAQFTATVVNDSANQGVTWALMYTQNGGLVPCPSATVCGSVSPTKTASGAAITYTAPSTPFAGQLEVALTATSVANSGASAQAFVFVQGITVSVAPPTASLQAAAAKQFTATVTDDSTNSGVSWTLTQNGTSCSPACGTIAPTTTASGTPTTYTAPSTPPPSNLAVTVTATSVALPAASGTATVTVLAITISVSPVSVLLPGGTAQQFTATVNNDPANAGVTWTLAQNGAACTSAACGTLSSGTTNPTTYSAPAKVSTNSTVALTTYSVTDPSKTATANLHLTTGTVEIVPDALNFGSVVTNTTGVQRMTTLTNTGSTALNITGITITGTDPGDFSQTNMCNSSVGAAASCTITVTFIPKTIGTRSATISIADSSTDSPQQVSLSGSGSTRRPLNVAAMRFALANVGNITAPSPTGRSPVGTRVVNLIDSTREDPFAANGAKREIAVRFWYPASLKEACKPAEYTSPAVWQYFSELTGVPPFRVATNSCLNAPVSDGAHPVVLFTPGYTATFTDYTFLFEDLASRGYIVGSVAHTHETTAVELPGRGLVKGVFGSHLADTWRGDEQTFSLVTNVRLQDLELVFGELQHLNALLKNPFAGHLDMTSVAIAGHSLGGLTSFLAVGRDSRFKAGIVLDSYVPEHMVRDTTTPTPVLFFTVGRNLWDAGDCRLWSDLKGPRLVVNLRGAEHVALSDFAWLAKDGIQTGPMGPEKTIAAARAYVASFLDAHLRGEPMDPLLTGPSPDYPDAAVITQEQSLCRQP